MGLAWVWSLGSQATSDQIIRAQKARSCFIPRHFQMHNESLKENNSDVRVRCYSSSHIFLFLVLRRTLLLFFQMLPRKEPEEVFLVFPSIFSKFHGQILHLLASPSNFLKSHYLIKRKKTKQKLHLFQLLFQAISLHDLFLAVTNKCYYLCFYI